jgi:hypothetical protein
MLESVETAIVFTDAVAGLVPIATHWIDSCAAPGTIAGNVRRDWRRQQCRLLPPARAQALPKREGLSFCFSFCVFSQSVW